MAHKTLVTGGAGFIGSHLTRLLKQQGRDLILVDDLSTGRRSNIESQLDDRCRLVEGRVGDVLGEDSSLLDGVEEIYHLAAAVGVKLVVDDPIAMIHNNIAETETVLAAANRAGARVLIASSSEVYGKGVRMPLSEEQDLVIGPTTAPRWSYALSKALDEHLALSYHRKQGTAAVIVRLFNTIGPRQIGRYGMVAPRFVRKALAGEPLEIYGSGQQTRAFCDVRNVVDAMVRLMADPKCHGEVFNLGSDREITIEHLADRVIALCGSGASKKLIPYDEAYDKGFEDPQRRVPDLSRIRAAIGYEPTIPLDETLTAIIESIREEPASAVE